MPLERAPGYSGAEDLFQRIEFNKETYEFRAFTRLKELKYLQRTGQIDAEFFWR